MDTTQQDVIIIGGGMVGAASALGLAKLGLKVALLEKNPLPLFSATQPYDLRISAISAASVKLLEQLGAWQAIKQMRACPYDGLETWEMEGFHTKFTASELALSELGYMVENNLIQIGLWQTLSTYSHCQQAVGFEHIFANREADKWVVTLDNNQTFSAPLLIGADGANSWARRWANIGLTRWQYRQHCLLAIVETESPQQSVTWQQFFPTGPRAFLPLLDRHACLVWYDSPQRIQQLKQYSAEKLSEEILSHFPNRLGKINVLCHDSFPLARQHAQSYFNNGIVLIGDAAHTINPLAGQGVNLGFKDVVGLLNVIEKALQKGEELNSETVLKRYEQSRRLDNLLMQTGMDLFYKTFKTDLLPLKIVRNLGFLMAQKATPIKKQVLKYAIGL